MSNVRDNPPPTGSIRTLGSHFEFWVYLVEAQWLGMSLYADNDKNGMGVGWQSDLDRIWNMWVGLRHYGPANGTRPSMHHYSRVE
jgi:hypothetical protein